MIGREAAIAGSVFDTLFPLDSYDQTLSKWINPNDSSYNQALLSNGAQQYRKEELINHLLGSSSPWNQAHVSAVLRGDLMKTEETFFSIYNNKNETRYFERKAISRSQAANVS